MADDTSTPPSPLARVAVESLRVIQWPDPRLRLKSEPVAAFDDMLREVAQKMFELMRSEGGVGLAAPQVGLNVRLFVANPTGKPEDDKVYVNPVLSDAEGGEEGEEGCLSLPEIHVNVVRPTARVTMTAQDLTGQSFEQVGEGYLTRIWQHEIDHLNGVLILDRMGPLAKLQYRKTLKGLEEKYEALQKPKKPRVKLPF